jgi:predicted lipoprotein
VLAVAGILAVFPPFHIRPIDQARDAGAAAAFDPASGAAGFWSAHVEGASERALQVADLAAKLSARETDNLGRRSSVGGEPFFVVRGEGRVVSVEPRAVRVEVEGTDAEVLLRVGPLFGNVLRDSFESAEVSALSSFDANALGGELNKIAEREVQPAVVAAAQSGNVVSFVGVTQRRETADGHVSIVIIPLSIQVVK